MSFVHKLLSYNSVSIVGLEKNTGKTETLNYVLRQLKDLNKIVAVTSVGIDGEKNSHLNNIPKPEIELFEGTVFVTSEQHYTGKKLIAKILDLPPATTALGRLVVAKAVSRGKVVLSGPSDSESLKRIIAAMDNYGVHITLVDGAISRISHASPVVTDAMILATGAALSANINVLIQKTRFVKELIDMETAEEPLNSYLQQINTGGIWAIDKYGYAHDLKIPSVFMLDKMTENIFQYGDVFYVTGAVSNRLLEFFGIQNRPSTLIVRDFTKIFVTPECLATFIRKQGKIKYLLKTKLIAVTVNPVSPAGFSLNSLKLREEMEKNLNIPVFDVKNMIGRNI